MWDVLPSLQNAGLGTRRSSFPGLDDSSHHSLAIDVHQCRPIVDQINRSRP
jgi:hypothetical protein